jgi:vacuolar-type H+-ATPase subunit C/Vma6
MFRREYHCLVAGLPALFFDATRLATSLTELKTQLTEDLYPSDYQLIKKFFLRYDNRNILNILKGNSSLFDPLGNYSLEHVEEIIGLLKDEDTDIFALDFPVYLSKFIRAYKSDSPLINDMSWENQLTQLYYEHLSAVDNDFIREWYNFDLDLTNIITAINCRKHGLDIRQELIGESEINLSLIKSSARDFGLSNEFPFLEEILRAADENDIMERERKFDLIKWKFLDDRVFFYYFTIEFVFTFIIKVDIISRWLKLDKETGEKMFRELISTVKTSYKFPEEFII